MKRDLQKKTLLLLLLIFITNNIYAYLKLDNRLIRNVKTVENPIGGYNTYTITITNPLPGNTKIEMNVSTVLSCNSFQVGQVTLFINSSYDSFK